jgi:hypothetical protein
LFAVCQVEVAVLVDVGSGMTLDAWAGGDGGRSDPELLGAAHADVVRALVVAGAPSGELVLSQVGLRHHVIRCVADPCGGRLALGVVVRGSPRVVRRALNRLREIPDEWLTAGPGRLSPHRVDRGEPPPAARHGADAGRMPAFAQIDSGWVISPVKSAGLRAAPVVTPRSSPAPPSALPPARRPDRG